MSIFRQIVLAIAVAALGCASPCRQIQNAMCECKGRTADEKTSCRTSAGEQEKLDPPTDDELATCERLLPDCEQEIAKGCGTLQTTAGRVACGLSDK